MPADPTPTPLAIAADLLSLAAKVARMSVGGYTRREVMLIVADATEIARDLMQLARQAREDGQ